MKKTLYPFSALAALRVLSRFPRAFLGLLIATVFCVNLSHRANAQSGEALNFDGVNDFVAVPHNANLNLTNTFTFSMWFKSNSLGQSQKYLLNKGNYYGILYEYVDNQIEFYSAIYTGTDPRPGSQMLLTDLLWHHIAYTYDGTTLKGYMDGVLTISVAKAFTLGTSSADLYLGAANTSQNNAGGSMDEVRIWNRALTAAEVLTDMNCGTPTTDTGLRVNYHFNQGTAAGTNAAVTSLTDASGNNTNGTLTNFALTGATSNWVAPGAPAVEINLLGNATTIADGDITPSVSDHTDFENVPIGNNFIRLFTIQNTGTKNLTISSIAVTGTHASLFTAGLLSPASPIAPGASATFTLTFTPTGTGLKNATVTIISDDCDEANYNFAVQATGLPIPTLGSYPAATIATAGGNAVVTPSAAPGNATSITAYATSSGFKGLLQVNPLSGVVTITNAHPAGSYIITVRSGITGSSFLLTVNNTACSRGLFSTATNMPVGNEPQSVAVGDFNGDGKQDIITANFNSNNVSVLLGNGSGSFSTATAFPVGDAPYSVAIEDFNGDGKQDIVAANIYSDNVSVLLGNGSGSFSTATHFSVGGAPFSVAIGDFNGDGNRDIATANALSLNVCILLGNGRGSFSTATNFPVGDYPNSVATGDFNGDGKQDIAAGSLFRNNVSVLLGNGSGSFSPSTTFTAGEQPGPVAIGDFNGDGKQDIAATISIRNNVSVLLGNGSGSFSPSTTFTAGEQPGPVAIGDFNGDGKQDIAVGNVFSDNVSILLGNGNGSFNPATAFNVGATAFNVGNEPRSVAIGDFNGDGKQDIVTANSGSNNVSILLGSANEINVQGNSVDIVDGDTTPSLSDHTDFGSVPIGSTLTRTFTIQNTGTQPLTLVGFARSGANASLFTVGPLSPDSPIAPGGFATFTLTFTPTTSGLKTATIAINSDDCDEANYDFAVQATGGICPTQLTLVSTADDFASGTQLKAAAATNGNITATNKITGTAQATYRAKVIELRPGFQANSGTVFSAQQGGCN